MEFDHYRRPWVVRAIDLRFKHFLLVIGGGFAFSLVQDEGRWWGVRRWCLDPFDPHLDDVAEVALLADDDFLFSTHDEIPAFLIRTLPHFTQGTRRLVPQHTKGRMQHHR